MNRHKKRPNNIQQQNATENLKLYRNHSKLTNSLTIFINLGMRDRVLRIAYCFSQSIVILVVIGK